MKTKSLLTLLLIHLLVSTSILAQNDVAVTWNSGATDRIYGSPALVGNQLFYGSIDGNLHCVDYVSGRKYYHINLEGSIRSTPLSYKITIIVVAGNDILCYDPVEMNIKWRFEPKAAPTDIAMDEWDYHHASPVLHDGQVYFGSSNGNLYQINPESGDSLMSWSTDEQDAIRTTPTIKEEILYFGDWRGRIYALDLASESYKWTKATRTGQYYENFAGILATIEIGEDMIYYGARNQTIKALNKENGATVWSYSSPDGGWISGSPILYGDLLLIAGSDNHQMLCFDATNGDMKWTFTFPGNSFSVPMILEDKLIFTTGNAYSNSGFNYGRGFIHVLNLPEGSLYKEIEFDGNVFSSPVRLGPNLLFGSDNKNLYSLDIFELTGIETSFTSILPSTKTKFHCYPNPSNGNINLTFEMPTSGEARIELTDLTGKLLHTKTFSYLPAGAHSWKTSVEIGSASQFLLARLILDNRPQKTLRLLVNQ